MVLVVEDDPILLGVITKKLTIAGFDSFVCRTGADSIEYLKSAVTSPDVIWLDLYLPDMMGDDIMREIQKHESWKDIPVVVVSNVSDGEKIEATLSLGAKKYMLKSQYELEEIIEQIQKILKTPS